MGASNTERSKTNFFQLKAKTSDTDPSAYFGRNTKVGAQWQITDKYNSFTGILTDIKHSTYEYEGQTKHKCELTLKDKDGTINLLSSNFSNLLYSLLNAISGTTPGFIEMNLSLGKAKIINGKEGKRFPSIWVKNDGEDVKWKYDVSQQPKADKVKVGNNTVTDDSKVVAFWIKVIEDEIKPKLKGDVRAQAEGHVADPEGSDLPF